MFKKWSSKIYFLGIALFALSALVVASRPTVGAQFLTSPLPSPPRLSTNPFDSPISRPPQTVGRPIRPHRAGAATISPAPSPAGTAPPPGTLRRPGRMATTTSSFTSPTTTSPPATGGPPWTPPATRLPTPSPPLSRGASRRKSSWWTSGSIRTTRTRPAGCTLARTTSTRTNTASYWEPERFLLQIRGGSSAATTPK